MTRSNVSRSFSRKARRKSIQSFRIDSRWRRYVGIVRPTPIGGPETIRAGAGEGWAKVPQSHPVQEEVDRPAAGDEPGMREARQGNGDICHRRGRMLGTRHRKALAMDPPIAVRRVGREA